MQFCERLFALRKERAETQVCVAEATGITVRQYSRYEANEQKPSFDALIALADYFDVSLDYLTGRSNER